MKGIFRSAAAALVVGCATLGASLWVGDAFAQTSDPTVARATAGAPQVDPALSAELLQGGHARMLVYLRAQPDLSRAPTLNWNDRGRTVVDALRATADASQRRVRELLDARGVEHEAFWIDNVIVVPAADAALVRELQGLEEIALLRASPTVVLFEPPPAEPAAPAVRAVESNLTQVKAPLAWAAGFLGNNIVVASIDTGVRYTHGALAGKYRGNLGGGSFDHNYNWWDPYAGSSAPEDTHDHGSHVTGTMVGDDGAGNQIGMAPQAKWIACKGFTPSATDAGLLSCAQFMAAPTNLAGGSPNPALRPHVVNNSWGDCGRSYDGWYQAVINNWHAAGIYPVFANGNASNCSYASPPGLNTVGNPGRYGNVTGVGSTGTSNGIYANHSNWGPTDNLDTVNAAVGHGNIKPQVVAPGVAIRSSLRGSNTAYGTMSGTSMSAPHVAGLIALVWQAGPCLVGDYATTETLLEVSATPRPYASNQGDEGPGNVPNHATGWGEIDAEAAVALAGALCGDLGTIAGTVTDASTGDPIEGARVRAYAAPPPYFETTTGADGSYSREVPAGTVTVEFSAFGYGPVTAIDVVVGSGATTVLDIAMQPLPLVTLSGTVTDAGTGWPLYARVEVAEMPDLIVWTDPATGTYSAQVFGGIPLELMVTAWSNSYAVATRSVGPYVADAVENFGLGYGSSNACSLPWALDVFGPETFTATTLPAGWTVVDNLGAGRVWRFDNPGNRANLTGGTGNFAIVDSDFYGSGNSQDTELRTPPLDLSAAQNPFLRFSYDFRVFTGSQAEIADVDVSANGGASWLNVWRRTADARGPRTDVVDLVAFAGQPSVVVRFRYYQATYEWWWQVDDVSVRECGSAPTGWGVVYGNISDANTGAALTGALVDAGTQTAIAAATPDPQQGNAFYVLYLPAGVHALGASFPGFASAAGDVEILPGEAVRLDLALAAGQLQTDPTQIDEQLVTGTATVRDLLVLNTGGQDLTYTISRLAGAAPPRSGLFPYAETEKGSESGASVRADGGSTVLPPPAAGLRTPGSIAGDGWTTLPPAPTAVSRPAGVALGSRFYVIGGESSSAAATDGVQVWNGEAWSAGPPMPVALSNACATALGSSIYVVSGNRGDGSAVSTMQVLDTVTGTWTELTGDPAPGPRMGSACAAHGGLVYQIGGSTNGSTYESNLWVYDPAAVSGSRWTVLAAAPITGAWGSAAVIGDRIFYAGMRNTTADLANVYAYVPGTGWVTYPSLVQARGGAAVWALGTDLMVGGGGWATFRTSTEVYDTTLGVAGSWQDGPSLVQGRRTFARGGDAGVLYVAAGWAGAYLGAAEAFAYDLDLPWLWTVPVQGTVAAGGQQLIDVHLDASALDAGTYTARLRFSSDTPYPSTEVPVTLVVVNPAPQLLSVTPPSGLVAGGTTITLLGAHFQPLGTTTVSVGASPCGTVEVVDAATITCVTPAAATAGSVAVTVTNPDGQSVTLEDGFTYVFPPPVLLDVQPAQGPSSGGESLQISGGGFLDGAEVLLGASACIDVVVVDAETLTCTTTESPVDGAVEVSVRNPDDQVAVLADGYTFVHVAPELDAVSPDHDWTTGGSVVTLTGGHFRTIGTTTVSFGGEPCGEVVVVDAATITCVTPAMATAGSVDVTVTNPDGQSVTLEDGFTYLQRAALIFRNGFED